MATPSFWCKTSWYDQITSAKALDINIPMPKEELGKLLTDLLAKVDGTTHFVYWQVTRGVETRNHVYAENLPGKLWVSIRQNHLNDPDVPIKLNTEEDTRFYHCNIKTLNLLPSVVAAQHAKRIGVQETVLHRGDIVTECAHSNVSILKDGVFYSHQATGGVAPRKHLAVVHTAVGGMGQLPHAVRTQAFLLHSSLPFVL